MSLSVQLWYHIAAHRTVFLDKELSIQDAYHETFKRPHDQTVKEGVVNRLLQCTETTLHRPHSGEIANCTANNILPTQRAFWITSQVREASSLLRHLIQGAQGHSKRPSSAITSNSLIRSSLVAPLINKRYNGLLDNGQL